MNYVDQLKVLQQFIGKEFNQSPSPFMRWLKPTVRAAERGALSFSYLVREEMLNPSGVLHGGVTAAIIDDVIGATMFTLNEQLFYTTINNVVDYFSIARQGDTIVADTKIIKKGKQVVNVECTIWNEDKSRLIAKGSSNLMQVNIKKPE